MAKVKMDMTEGAILPKLIKFALPVMATSIIHQLFNTADALLEFCLQLRCSVGVESTGKGDNQFSAVQILFDSHFIILLISKILGLFDC